MPRYVHPTLRMMLERTNPNVCDIFEASIPDQSNVLRRWEDQFSVNPPKISETPATTIAPSARGGLTLKSSPLTIANFMTNNTGYTLGSPALDGIYKGVGWKLADTLKRVTLNSITVKIQRVAYFPGLFDPADFELQVFRPVGHAGDLVFENGVPTQPFVQYGFEPLLPNAIRITDAQIQAAGGYTSGIANLVFDLTPYGLTVEHKNVPAPSLTQTGEPQELMIVLWRVASPTAVVLSQWREDSTTSPTVTDIGTFKEVTWTRADPNSASSPWIRSEAARCPCIKIDVDEFVPTSEEVYSITLPKTPRADAVGRIVFRAPLPTGTSATLKISTTGSGGSYSAVVDGQEIATHQTTYHLKLTMTASADQKAAPEVTALGIEFRVPVDLSAEASIEAMPQDVNLPFLEAAIGEGRLRIVRFGRRDFRDKASDLLAGAAATKIEIDHYLGSRHPAVTRDMWLHLSRTPVSSGTPTATSEVLTLLSLQKMTKKKIPVREETIATVHRVIGSPTTTSVQVTPTLKGSPAAGAWAGLGYYMRVKSSTQAGVETGRRQTIDSNSAVDTLTFSPALPGTLAVGDEIEVHSNRWRQGKLSWVNADPAAVLDEIFATHLGVPSERMGLSDLGGANRSGLWPTVLERAPGDAATQTKLKVSLTTDNAEDGDKLIDQLSFHTGGVTLEIAGQFVWVRIYPALGPSGEVIIPLAPVAASFDPRDVVGLETPRGLEQRTTVLSCDYGVDSSLPGTEQPPPSTATFVDADAVDWFSNQDVEGIGFAAVPDDIARWCFNSTDQGEYLASLLCRQVARYGSTGLRVWSWSTVDQHPELCVGDTVVVTTDQYVDYDPSARVAIRGWWSFPLVLVHVGRAGREFRGVMPGLQSAIPLLGGAGPLSTGIVAQPQINASFDAGGNLIVNLNMGNPAGAGFRVAASSPSVPSDSTVDASAYVPAVAGSARVNLGSSWTAGAVVQIKAISYAGDADESAKSLASVVEAVAPTASATPAVTSVSVTGQSIGGDVITVAWTVANAPVGALYDLIWSNDNLSTTTTITGVTTPYSHNRLGAGGHGWDIVAGGQIDKIWYSVRMKDSGGTPLTQSGWISADVDHA